MSEHQYVAFRAIDAPLNTQNLEFMRKQSTRAEITPWSFENEYHFGDFRGDAKEMLRRGYDFHFHYANFGYRMLMIRLPDGLPDPAAAKPYFEVKQRSSEIYEKIALLLSDLRAAMSLTEQSNLAEEQARKLKEQNPTLRVLTGALRRKGFLKKPSSDA